MVAGIFCGSSPRNKKLESGAVPQQGVRVRVRIDAGFTGNPTLVAMEERGIKYLGRLRSNKPLQTWRRRISSSRPAGPRSSCGK